MLWNLNDIGNIYDLINDEVMSGADIVKQSSLRASYLHSLFGSNKKCYVIAHGNSPSFFADLFAVWQVGGCAVCINSGLTGPELENIVDFVQASAVLVGDNKEMSLSVPVINLQNEDAPENYSSSPEGTIDDPALILFTSGTTGKPKGVVHSHRSLLSRISLNQAYLGRDTLNKTLSVLPTHFGHGLIGNCLTSLLAGGDLYLNHGSGINGASQLGAIIDQHKISFMSSVPSFWKLALRMSAKPVEKTIKRIHIGSAPLSADLWQKIIEWAETDQVANMYGITETANWIGGAIASESPPEDGLLGKPWGGSIAILNAQGEITKVGEGEVLIQSPSLMTEYYLRDDLTHEVLRNGWYYTGDLGSIDEQGVLRMTGRNKYVINLAGIKIYPEEIDLLLERHTNINEVCTFALPDGVSGELVAVAIKLNDNEQASEADIITWLTSRIRREAIPSKFFFLDDIPKTDRGKLNRDNVAQFCLSQQGII